MPGMWEFERRTTDFSLPGQDLQKELTVRGSHIAATCHQARTLPVMLLSTHELLSLLERVMVEEVMTSHPPTVTPEALLIEASRLDDRRIGGLIVVEGGEWSASSMCLYLTAGS